MKKILLIINDIDPNIYLNGITEDFDLYVIYVIPKSSAMKKKFKECINKHQSVSWIAVASEEIVLQEIKNYSHKEKFDMIIAYDEDGIIPIEKMKRDLGLLNQYENIKDICDKAYQRKTISKKYPELSGGCFEIEHIKDLNFFPDNFKFPAVLKPVSLSGSRYVIKIEDYSDLIVKFKEICNKNEQKCKYIVEEEFIGTDWYDSCNIYGDYVSVESIVSFGKITHLAICDKTPIVYPFRETGLIFPSMLDEQKQKLLFQSAEKIIKALKYNFGPTHIEFKLTANGPKFIEFNPRAGGPIPIQIQLSSKYNIIKNILLSYLGKEVEEFNGFNNSSSCFYFELNVKNKVKIISINQNINWKQIEGVHEYVLLKHPGDIVDPLLGVRSMIGFAYIKANTSSQCISIAKKIYSLFDIEYENI